MEKTMVDLFEQFGDVNKSVVEPVLRLNEITVRAQGRLARQQLAVVECCLESGTRQLQAVSEAKDPKELVSMQAEAVVELGEKLMAAARETLDIQVQTKDEFTRWFEDGFKALQAAPVAKPAAKAAKKAA